MKLHPQGATDLRISVSVIIPTFQRSRELGNAIRSVAIQSLANENIRPLVIDNNPTPQEREQVEALSDLFHHPIYYRHIPNAGLCNARNAAMEHIETPYVAFLDDDMVASENWLSSLLQTSKTNGTGIVFGPTFAIMPDADDRRNPYLKPLFSRLVDNQEDGLIDKTLGAGGCFLDLSLCNLPNPVFDPALNNRGGEDDILFDLLRREGTLVAWSINAVCYEIVPIARTRPAYIRARNFGYGQGPVRIQASRGISGVPAIIYYMCAGAAQTALYVTAYLLTATIGKPSSVNFLARASQGLGKIFWGERFALNLYGKPSLTPHQQPIDLAAVMISDEPVTPSTAKETALKADSL